MSETMKMEKYGSVAKGVDVMETCGCFAEGELEKLDFKPRIFTWYPGSLARPIDSDRIIHCKRERSEKCPSSKPHLVSCEIESDPSKHPIEHLVMQNGFKMPGACRWLEARKYE